MASKNELPPGWTKAAWRVLCRALSKPPSARTMAESRCFIYFATKTPFKPVEAVWNTTDEASEKPFS